MGRKGEIYSSLQIKGVCLVFGDGARLFSGLSSIIQTKQPVVTR